MRVAELGRADQKSFKPLIHQENQNISGSMHLSRFSCKDWIPAFLLDWPRTSTRSHGLLAYGLSRAEFPALQKRPWSLGMATEIPQSLEPVAVCWARATDPQSLLQLLKETRVGANPTDVPEQLPGLRASSSHKNMTLNQSLLSCRQIGSFSLL